MDSDTGKEEALWAEAHRQRRAILVVDVVESVRLMQANEADVIERWRRFVNEVRTVVLPAFGGQLVKSLGDGMLMDFADPRQALNAARDIHERIRAYNAARDTAATMLLRMGVHVAPVVRDELDIYGAGVNLAARIAGLARPGEIVVSAEVHDQLVPGLDADLEDLGDCELKGMSGTVRAYRVLAGQAGQVPLLPSTQFDARVAIAVLPPSLLGATAEQAVVGDVLADDIVQALSGSPHLKVISRLTVNAFRGRNASLEELRRLLMVDYVVSGSCMVDGGHISLRLELADTRNGEGIWHERFKLAMAKLFDVPNEATVAVLESVSAAIVAQEARRSRNASLATLRSYSLLLGAVSMMHRLSRADFEHAREMLVHLCERHPRAPEPLAWLAKWHVMSVAQGWTHDAHEQARHARSYTQRALDHAPDNALALAVDGLSAAFLSGDLDRSQSRYEAALSANPSESLAWLFMSAQHAYCDRGAQAAEAALTALRLSPLDPLRYYYDSFAANALLAAGRYGESIQLGQRSIRANCTHMPTYRSMAIAQMLDGREAESRATVARLLEVHPGYSLDEFRRRYAGRGAAHAAVYEGALRAAGLPEQ